MDDLELDKNVRDEIRAKLREYFNGKIVRIQDGVETVKKILASNYVRPDEAQKVLSLLRE